MLKLWKWRRCARDEDSRSVHSWQWKQRQVLRTLDLMHIRQAMQPAYSQAIVTPCIGSYRVGRSPHHSHDDDTIACQTDRLSHTVAATKGCSHADITHAADGSSASPHSLAHIPGESWGVPAAAGWLHLLGLPLPVMILEGLPAPVLLTTASTVLEPACTSATVIN